ncbi:hypothetical protein NE237_000644 [Protea cynaroides]|uniref:Uncharacterized protein n=1 Tax=Protea cynaroides TaxID=273540 RepID=A0A9Q0QXD7_9MAGN|nr:hypothetical protein NE237_000644 [Protea cynaroides]
MDTKALAKSKRAHSQHHSKTKRSHPNQTSNAPLVSATTSTGNEKKPSGKQTREKTPQFHGSTTALPSNRDRYDEEFDSGAEDLSLGTTCGASDVVAPKSEGADYSYLISMAQSQLQSQANPNLDGFALFDDSLPDLNQGVSSMLSVRANRIMSRIGDDFIVGENATTSYDNSEGSKESNRQECDHFETTCESEVAEHISDILYHERGDKDMVVDYKNDAPSATSSSEHPGRPMVNHEEALLVNPVKIDSRRSEQTDTTEVAGSIAWPNLTSTTDSDKNSSRFEAAAAEAELDLLLDSFVESKFLDSSDLKEINSFEVVGRESSTPSPGLTPIQAQVASKSVAGTVIPDDAIDDLLWGVSNMKTQDNMPKHQDNAVLPDMPSTTRGSGSNSNVLSDIDSWLDTI